VNVAVRIQHHPSRADLLPALLERLLGFDDVQVITDPGGPKPSSWRTHRLCLESLPDAATHLLLIQDDAIPCADFADKALAAIEQHPTRIIVFFVPGFGHLTRRIEIARRKSLAFVDLPGGSFVPVVCIAYPAEIACAIPAFADARRMPVSRADDAVVGTYARAHRLFPLATVPSLVDHDDTVPSAMGMRTRPGQKHRVAALFADA
jgi:hypothetical protein